MADAEEYDSLVRRASIALESRDLTLASELSDEALRVDPAAPDAYYVRGRVFFELGKADEALRCFADALRLDSTYYPALLGRAMTVAARLPNETAALCDQALSMNPETEYAVWAYCLKADALLHAGDRHGALKAAEEGLVIAPQDPELRLRQACALYELGRFEPCERAVRDVLSHTPHTAFERNLLAKALQRLGRSHEADEEFRYAALLAPSQFCVPCRLTESEFDALIRDALSAIRTHRFPHVDDVSISVKEFVPEELISQGINPDVHGVYQGGTIHQATRVMPARIILFQRPIENRSSSLGDVRAAVYDIVCHELGHHFGLTHDMMRRPNRDT